MTRNLPAFLLFLFCSLTTFSQNAFPPEWKYHAGTDTSWAGEKTSDDQWQPLAANPDFSKEKIWYRVRVTPQKESGSHSGVLVLSIKNFGAGQRVFWNGKLVESREMFGTNQVNQKNSLLHYYIHDVAGNEVNWGKENILSIRVAAVEMPETKTDKSDFTYRYIPAESAFGYSFNFPHRITVGLPTNSNRTILEVYENRLKLLWTYGNLKYFPFVSYKPLGTDWNQTITTLTDGKPAENVTESRLQGSLPILKNVYEKNGVTTTLEVAGADTATLVKISLVNNSSTVHDVIVRSESSGNWAGYNPGWLDSAEGYDRLLAGWLAPANQIVILGIGADKFATEGSNGISMKWRLKPGEKKTAWMVRPYNSFEKETEELRKTNWELEFEKAKQVWVSLLAGSMQLQVPDKFVSDAYYAALADCYIMREPIGNGYISAVMGTEFYRSGPSNVEPMLVAVALDQNGLHKDAIEGIRVDLDLQEANGDWSEPGGWPHKMWAGIGFKVWAVMEHFYLTQDTEYLKKMYPKMLASTRWQDQQRMKTKLKGISDTSYGLMPRGMGDCGLMNGSDFYGIYFPHNMWSVFADSITLSAAYILQRTSDIPELKRIFEEARKNLLRSMDRGAITTSDGSRWIPGVAGKESGSRWGALNATFPTGTIKERDPLINGTLQFMDQNQSPGGLQMNTGWLKNGMWVAISLDNVAETHLVRNEGDEAARLLMAVLNHGTPLYTWCEERGPESYTDTITGDRQHLWTPVALVRYLRDALIMEGDQQIFLGKGVDRAWVLSGKEIGVQNAPTHFGNFTYSYQYDDKKSLVRGTIVFPAANTTLVTWFARLPIGYRIKSVDKESGAKLLQDGSGLVWQNASGKKNFQVTVVKK